MPALFNLEKVPSRPEYDHDSEDAGLQRGYAPNVESKACLADGAPLRPRVVSAAPAGRRRAEWVDQPF
jgi:hypothetical protein